MPDHSSLTRIRDRLGLAVFQRFFEHVVILCQQAGLVWGKKLFFDVTKVRTNADLDSLVPRFYWRAKQHLDDLFAGEAAEPADPTPEVMPDPVPGPESATWATEPTDLPAPLTADP